jgi:hypothetical protein
MTPERHGEEWVYTCPECGGSKKLWWNPGRAVGHCFKCSLKITGLVQFRRLLKTLPPTTPAYQPVERSPTLTEWLPAEQSPEAMAYLQSRNVPLSLCREIGIEWAGHEIRFPIWSPLNEAREWVRRSLYESGWLTDRINKGLYWFGKPKEVPEQLILVEGVFDLLTPSLWGYGCALLGSNLSVDLECYLIAHPPKTITLWLDADLAGFQKGEKLLTRLRNWHPSVWLVHGWRCDPRDPGEYSPKEARRMLRYAWDRKDSQPVYKMPAL